MKLSITDWLASKKFNRCSTACNSGLLQLNWDKKKKKKEKRRRGRGKEGEEEIERDGERKWEGEGEKEGRGRGEVEGGKKEGRRGEGKETFIAKYSITIYE